MRKRPVSFLIAFMTVLFSSCEYVEKDFGFPKKVTFSKDGGEMTLSGDHPFISAYVTDYKSGNTGGYGVDENGGGYSEYKWLKVEYEYSMEENTEVKLTCVPNTSGRRRKLFVELYSDPEYAVVKVIQND